MPNKYFSGLHILGEMIDDIILKEYLKASAVNKTPLFFGGGGGQAFCQILQCVRYIKIFLKLEKTGNK